MIETQVTHKTVSHYKLLEKLGEGGMGVVYKAEDTRLERTVAIKFLPRHIAVHAEERERFRIEAKAAAALNHPNIATIYSIEEVDDDTFIVMEFIDGQDLRAKIKEGPIDFEEALKISIQAANGLQAAHKKGITHRDIKSSNIMLAENHQVKIMDFGLAKLAGGIQLTKTGTIVGTVAYMSPEQARGEPIDHRTDIWSLGVVIYEMLTGHLPFKGYYEQAVIYSILNEEPEPLTNLRPSVPAQMEQIVTKAMSKNTSERYHDLQEMILVLNALTTEGKSALIVPPKTLYRRSSILLLVAILVSVIFVLFTQKQRFDKTPREISVAHPYYLKGYDYYERSTNNDNENAIKFFKEAIRVDSNYAPAYAGVANAYIQRATVFNYPPRWLDSAIAASKKAILISPKHADAYKALGLAFLRKGMKTEAYEAYRKAGEIEPNFNPETILPSNWVNDYSNLLKDFEEEILNDKISVFKEETTIEIVVLLIPTIKPYFDDHKTFSTRTFNRWGIGEKTKDNGMFFTIATNDRQVRISVGDGMETVFTNEICEKILDDKVIPNIKQSDYFEAIAEFVNAVAMISRDNLKMLQAEWEFRLKTQK